jgi:hypothetical protein
MAYEFTDPLDELHDEIIRAHGDIKNIAKRLRLQPVSDGDRQICLGRAERAIKRLQKAATTLSMNPASLLGRIGGQKTAERGPEYFRKIAAMRKVRSGGRPRKEKQG